MSPIGSNTISGQQLRGFIERVERVRAAKKELADEENAIFAELKAVGFSPKRVREVLKIRTIKPGDLDEAQQELDMYLHACGMAREAPLFRAVGMMNVDLAAREQVIDAFKQLVPQNGEIIIKVGKQPVRLWRDDKGVAHAEDFVEAPAPASTPRPTPQPRPARDVPNVDLAGAFELGQQAFHANEPITSNPFSWDDPRRERFDAGWRDASGSDGMGPDT